MPNTLVDRSWPLLRHLTGAHVALYRRSGGRLGHKPPFAPPMLLLDHVGARSGIRRTSPLVYTHVGDDYVLVASKGGYPRHPAWFHNLRANPDTTIQVGRHVVPVHAHVASDEERAPVAALRGDVRRLRRLPGPRGSHDPARGPLAAELTRPGRPVTA